MRVVPMQQHPRVAVPGGVGDSIEPSNDTSAQSVKKLPVYLALDVRVSKVRVLLAVSRTKVPARIIKLLKFIFPTLYTR